MSMVGLASVSNLITAFFFQYNFAYKKSAYVGQSSNEVLSRVWNDILRFSGRFWHLFRFQEHRGLLCGHSGDL